MSHLPVKLTTSIILASAASGIVFLWYYYKKNQNRIPVKWKLVGYIDKLAIYPVKSCGYMELDEAICTERGLKESLPQDGSKKYLFRDREFVVYDVKDNNALNVIKQRKAVLIHVYSPDDDTIVFYAPGVEDFQFKLSSISDPKLTQIKFSGCFFDTVDCGDEIAKWLSNFLIDKDEGFRLGYYLQNVTKRPNVVQILTNQSTEFLSVYKHLRNQTDEGGLYSALASYLVVNRSSLDELNSKLAEEDQCTIYNFRPNIIVKGCNPFEEDKWKWIKIGDEIVMRYLTPCTRCFITTINADTGKGNTNVQPLKLMKSYRKVKQVTGADLQADKPVFGANMGLYIPGKVKSGDPVYASF